MVGAVVYEIDRKIVPLVSLEALVLQYIPQCVEGECTQLAGK